QSHRALSEHKTLSISWSHYPLDESNKHNVNEMIHRYVREQNIAVLWVTHDKDEINHADKVITLQPHAGEMQEARYELA
ncbi:TPA: hypothetical protein ACM5H1_004780, partial [Escherichia coli]